MQITLSGYLVCSRLPTKVFTELGALYDRGSVLRFFTSCPSLIRDIPEDFLLFMLPRFFNGTEILTQWTAQKLNNVDRTHLVLQSSATKKILADI